MGNISNTYKVSVGKTSLNILRVIKSRRWERHVARMEGERRCTQGFGGGTCGKENLGRPRRRWEDNMKMDLQEVGWWE